MHLFEKQHTEVYGVVAVNNTFPGAIMDSRHRARNRRGLAVATAVALGALLALPAMAAGIPTGEPLEEVVVTASRLGLVGESQAASEGIVPGSSSRVGRSCDPAKCSKSCPDWW